MQFKSDIPVTLIQILDFWHRHPDPLLLLPDQQLKWNVSFSLLMEEVEVVLGKNRQIFKWFFFHQGNTGILCINEIPVYCTYTVYMRWAFKSVNVVSFLPCLFNLFAPLYSIMCIDFNDTRYL